MLSSICQAQGKKKRERRLSRFHYGKEKKGIRPVIIRRKKRKREGEANNITESRCICFQEEERKEEGGGDNTVS